MAWSQSDLLRYFPGNSSLKGVNGSSFVKEMAGTNEKGKNGKGGGGCGGTIQVTVEDDFSHVMGIKGHKVSVCIEHPSA